MDDQSSNLNAARDAYETEHEREAFTAGYDRAHGIACYITVRAGETYRTEPDDEITPETFDECQDVHRALIFESESNARCYSPWEYTAAKINALDESEAAWEAYEAGVALAIEHDLAGCTAKDYGIARESLV